VSLAGEAADIVSRFDRMFDEWIRMMPFRLVQFPRWWEAGELIRVEEHRENGTLVVRADLPGIDPEKDVELTISDGILHIEAERREEEKREEKGYVRQEVRYGSVSRSLPLPEGVSEARGQVAGAPPAALAHRRPGRGASHTPRMHRAIPGAQQARMLNF